MSKKTGKTEIVEVEELVVEDIDQYRDSKFMELVQKVSGFGTRLLTQRDTNYMSLNSFNSL